MSAVPDDAEHFDYIVVGAGSAGCLMANRLTKDGKHSVLLLEAGGGDRWIWIHIPVGYAYTVGNALYDWCFKTEAEAGMAGRSIADPARQGARRFILHQRHVPRCAARPPISTTGGSSASTAGAGTTALRYFKAHEDFQWGADDVHGAGGGLLRVESSRGRSGRCWISSARRPSRRHQMDR